VGSIVFDAQTGKLTEGLVWTFNFGDALIVFDEPKRAWADTVIAAKHKRIHECKLNKAHETDEVLEDVVVGLFGGEQLGDFLPMMLGAEMIVSRAFAQRLKGSGLKGLDVEDVVRADNQSAVKNPELRQFKIVGRAGFCRRWRIEGAANLCPYCKREPVLCAECGWRSFYECPRCRKRVHHGGGYTIEPDGKSLELRQGRDLSIVEANEWDGSDIFQVGGHGGGWYFNRRAKDWFERTHVLDTTFIGALLNVEGLGNRLPDGSLIGKPR
jgi:hypothetical protein